MGVRPRGRLWTRYLLASTIPCDTTMDPAAQYDELLTRVREAFLLTSTSALLSWDEQCYMPPGGAAHRGNQLALLAGLHHERLTHPRIGELLCALADSSLVADPLAPAAVNVRELTRTYRRLSRLPRMLVEELARTIPLSQHAWVAARRDNKFADFAPWLNKILTLKRHEAEALLDDSYGPGATLYDALLDEYEPGARAADIAELFAGLRNELVPLVTKITHARQQPNRELLRREFPLDRQRLLAEEAARAVGFDFHTGRLDTAPHPFCTHIGPGDLRITTRFKTNDFNDSFFGVLHEVGHALYEQGLEPEHYGTPLGEAVSLGIHESQSRLWENAVGRSRSFWQHFFPRAQRLFPDALGAATLDEFYFAVNEVEAGPNRVQADEVTYNLHIIARFELEQVLLTGELPAADLPGAWAEKYRHYLGVTPVTDSEGCLQDIHWCEGLLGYFPTYTLGNLYGAQLFAAARRALPDLDVQFARGEFAGLLDWLRENVHRHGHRFRPTELVERATGEKPSPRHFAAALAAKFAPLYEISL
ncbi:MAG: carboxypeptidase M32 [Planctomycetaceae bacterium]|nr:carboxypeptidase M32 [Planctomycetaceae bacterium]